MSCHNPRDHLNTTLGGGGVECSLCAEWRGCCYPLQHVASPKTKWDFKLAAHSRIYTTTLICRSRQNALQLTGVSTFKDNFTDKVEMEIPKNKKEVESGGNEGCAMKRSKKTTCLLFPNQSINQHGFFFPFLSHWLPHTHTQSAGFGWGAQNHEEVPKSLTPWPGPPSLSSGPSVSKLHK